ncbi:MAG: sigma-54-dependent Fis family transcriptional regulator [Syntrophomonadaceae bacterium]|jgi:transcriptional regulator of acetoin/glycerol metabolism
MARLKQKGDDRFVRDCMRTGDNHQVWEHFVKNGEILTEDFNPLIAASWRRCYANQVDPYDGVCHQVLDQEEFAKALKRRSQLIDIARPLMLKLNNYVTGSGFLVMLTDERGIILEMLGDEETIQKARSINFFKGAVWTEEQVGTNAIGTVLKEGIPLQVNSCQHYCQLHHTWTCSAAPIFNQKNQLIGVLNMSGPYQETHQHTLGMVVSAADAIMYQMRVQHQNTQLKVMNERMRNIVMTMSEGVVLLDKTGKIIQINQVAEAIFSLSKVKVEGKTFERFFPELAKIIGHLNQGQDVLDVETPVHGAVGITPCVASAKSIHDENGQVNGLVIIFNPVKRIRNLVNRLSGAHASFYFNDVIGRSPLILEAVQTAKLAADKLSNILLQGESGTGKELFAQAIHNASPRQHGPFIALNCGAIPRELLGSELFGYVDGAFTGARRGGRTGKFELASGGTLFLDEIGEMPLGKQVSLLRAVQEKEIIRIGDDKIIPVDVRIICATNKDLKAEVAKGNFRQDLYYRLNVISIKLPALRERPEDIPLQFNYFLEEMSSKMDMPVPRVQPEVMDYLISYDWPGNVRELQNVVERMMNISNGHTISVDHLPAEVIQNYSELNELPRNTKEPSASVKWQRHHKKQIRQQIEKQEILRLIDQCGGNISRIAEEMSVSRTTIYRKLRRYNIEV